MSLRICARVHVHASNGYEYVGLRKAGVFKRCRVHRMVLMTFVGAPYADAYALHTNDQKRDNRLANLRWGTAADNGADAVRNGVHPESRKMHCPRGHAYDSDNTYIRPDGKGRGCLACSTRRSREQNERRGRGPRVYVRYTHCNRGHEFTAENTYVRPDGRGRSCKVCIRERAKNGVTHVT